MNFFLEQGRCRVCGQIFCCFLHQRKHEKQEHEEYSYWLEILPINCRTCHKRISTIHDLNSKCILFNKHCFVEGNFGGTPRPSRKRRADSGNASSFQRTAILGDMLAHKKRLVSFPYRRKKKDTDNSPNLVFVDLNGMKTKGDAATVNAIFSPQLDVSPQILTSDTKSSSTPINEECKESMATVSVVSVTNDEDITLYCTPENKNMAGASLILVSALKKKKNEFIAEVVSKNGDERRVTFDTTSSPSETELSIYSTPMATMCCIRSSPNSDAAAASSAIEKSAETFHVANISPATPAKNMESDFPIDAAVSNEPTAEHKLVKIARNVRLTLNGIPRSLTSAWEWTQRRMRRKIQRDEFDSPISKRKKLNATLKRRPITSYWVNMSITSLVRDPLPNYKEKYSSVQGD